jgi:hypothetical protein
LLARAGLDINQLAADRGGRYSGPGVTQLTQLSAAERDLVNQGLVRQLQRAGKAGYVNAADGLNLRAGPSREESVITALLFGSELTILGEEGEWLFVKVGEQLGWVFATLVSPQPTGGTSGGTLPSFTGPLAPPTPLPIPAGATDHVMGAANTWNQYGGLIAAECNRLAFDPGVAVAILGVESSGRAFEGNRMIIRFENHQFLQYWGLEHRELFDRHFTPFSDGTQHRWRPDPNGPWLPCHANQTSEWQVFEFARTLNEQAAMYAISMGAAQIMGFNHTRIGYGNVQAMFEAFQADVRNQLTALFRFIEVNHLVDAVRRADFHAFARTYNGWGQEDVYAPRMQRYFDAYRQLLAEVVREHAEEISPLPEAATTAPLSADPEAQAMWRKHLASGFAENAVMFHSLVQEFTRAYWSIQWMVRILIGVAVASFLLAAALALFGDSTAAVVTFAALSAVALVSFFLSRPQRTLEQNLQSLTWLGVIFNTYWAQLIHLDAEHDPQQALQDATDEAIRRIKELMDDHGQRSGKSKV